MNKSISLILLIIIALIAYLNIEETPSNNVSKSIDDPRQLLDNIDITTNKPNANLSAHVDTPNTQQPIESAIQACKKYDLEFDMQTVDLKLNEYLHYLSQSNNDDNKLNFYLQSNDVKKSKQTLFNLLPTSNNEKLLFEQRLIACHQSFDTKYCNDGLYTQASLVDKDNAYFGYLIAAINITQKKWRQAHLHLKTANTRARFDEYYFEKIRFSEYNLRDYSQLNFSERLMTAIGHSSANSAAFYSDILAYCKMNTGDISILDICLHSGRFLENKSETYITRGFGIAIQEQQYKATENTDMLAKIKIRKQLNSDELQNSYQENSDTFALNTLIFLDERIGRAWLSTGLLKGESFAQEQAVTEMKTYSANLAYQPCKQSNN